MRRLCSLHSSDEVVAAFHHAIIWVPRIISKKTGRSGIRRHCVSEVSTPDKIWQASDRINSTFARNCLPCNQEMGLNSTNNLIAILGGCPRASLM